MTTVIQNHRETSKVTRVHQAVNRTLATVALVLGYLFDHQEAGGQIILVSPDGKMEGLKIL